MSEFNDPIDEMFAEAMENIDAQAAYDENAIHRELAKTFELRRSELDLTIRQLAEKMETSASQVQRILHTDVGGSLTLHTLCKASKALGLELRVTAVDPAIAVSRIDVLSAPTPVGMGDYWVTAEIAAIDKGILSGRTGLQSPRDLLTKGEMRIKDSRPRLDKPGSLYPPPAHSPWSYGKSRDEDRKKNVQ